MVQTGAAKVATLFGGSGFIGRYVVRHLAKQGHVIRVAVRHPESAGFLKPLGDVGQITPIPASLLVEDSVKRAVEGADLVVNLVGVLYEKGRQTFRAVHAEGAAAVARAAAAVGAGDLVHISALGADANSPADYARTKAAGEAAVREAFPAAVILRPSVVIGPEDDFFNRFAVMARLSPALPLLNGGRTRFQPVYVGDVALAIVTALNDPAARGRTYELGGPRVYSFKELLELLLHEIHRRRLLLSLPMPLARLQARVLELLPKPPLTRDQLRLLERDNVVGSGALTFADLGIQPQTIETVLPNYLDRYRPGGRFVRGYPR